MSLGPPPPRPVLFADRGCPFAHRVRALLAHLEVAYDLHEAPIGERPEGLERWSSSGRIPFLVHGPLAIGESLVMLEYLAEAYGFTGAWPEGLVPRTLQRHAMALMDSFVAPRVLREDGPVTAARLSECLDVIEAVTQATAPVPSLLAFHLAPIWICALSFRPDGTVIQAIRERPALAGWLDEAAGIAALRRADALGTDS
jgi:glutathione S-transferase